MLSTSPLSIAVPAGEELPFVLDMATTVVARGRIVLHAKQGLPIPEGWAVDEEGRPALQQPRDVARIDLQIGIERDDHITSRRHEARVVRGGHPVTLSEVHAAHARIFVHEALDQLVAPVARAVIDIDDLVVEHAVERVVVGLPTTLSGEEGTQAQVSRAFAEELGGLLDVPVETYDERLTTTMAERSARQGARADTDSLAAAHLLESYLAARQREAPPDG